MEEDKKEEGGGGKPFRSAIRAASSTRAYAFLSVLLTALCKKKACLDTLQ